MDLLIISRARPVYYIIYNKNLLNIYFVYDLTIAKKNCL